MPNHLADETSPYLLQHKDNPVDWYPWGEEALSRSRDLNRPLLVSIGYAACHWCHVMERESFEDPDVAAYMNDNFVCIKVDREERPDVDAIYMEAVQLITGHGGWPLNAFATPEQVPFHAGTYFPPQPRQGMPSWRQVLEAVSEAWRDRPDEILGGSDRLRNRLGISALVEPSPDPIDPLMPGKAVSKLADQFDAANGGFGSAPKFPQAPVLEFLLGRWTTGDPEAARMAERSLEGMISGSMYDQIGGGFARYSVDARWEIPHFEKMLYDNAPLARCYLRGWQLTERTEFQDVCRETLDFMLRELCDADGGGFYSSLDADSEGEEGKFYAWTFSELRELLGADADVAIEYFGATEVGNFDGKCALLRRGSPPEQLESIKRRLMEARATRVRPGLDDKRLTAWNALAVAALAEAGAVLSEPRYVDAAVRCAEFVLRALTDTSGRLLRSYNRGKATLPGFLDDYAYTVEAFISLYEATFDPCWLNHARRFADLMIEHFADPEYGGFFSTADDAQQLVARRKEFDDSPIPSGLSSAALGLQRLALLTAESRYEDQAVGAIKLTLSMAANHPGAFGELLQAVEFRLATNREVALVGSDTSAFEQIFWQHFRPFDVIAGGEQADVALLQDRPTVDGEPTAYVCVGYVCDAPQTDPAAFAKQLT